MITFLVFLPILAGIVLLSAKREIRGPKPVAFTSLLSALTFSSSSVWFSSLSALAVWAASAH